MFRGRGTGNPRNGQGPDFTAEDDDPDWASAAQRRLSRRGGRVGGEEQPGLQSLRLQGERG
jgi:hypothetical protein